MKDWAKMAVWVMIAGLIWWFVLPKFTSSPQKTAVSAMPGWDDLNPCSELVSFDGKKTLSLSQEGNATLEDNASTEKLTTKGKWELANAPSHYSILLNDKSLTYERIAPEGSSSCMLVVGTSFAANLLLSWFAVEAEPEVDPREE